MGEADSEKTSDLERDAADSVSIGTQTSDIAAPDRIRLPPASRQKTHRENDEHALEHRRPEEDPFEVGWDNGDADPLCPRSFSSFKKWVIVWVVLAGSLCV